MCPPESTRCQQSPDIFLSLCAELGVPLATEKLKGPTTSLSSLGIILNTKYMEIRLPTNKVTSFWPHGCPRRRPQRGKYCHLFALSTMQPSWFVQEEPLYPECILQQPGCVRCILSLNWTGHFVQTYCGGIHFSNPGMVAVFSGIWWYHIQTSVFKQEHAVQRYWMPIGCNCNGLKNGMTLESWQRSCYQ